ncbi:MAG: hypothetical protein AAGA90_17595 [Actinomycetota bacterium]
MSDDLEHLLADARSRTDAQRRAAARRKDLARLESELDALAETEDAAEAVVARAGRRIPFGRPTPDEAAAARATIDAVDVARRSIEERRTAMRSDLAAATANAEGADLARARVGGEIDRRSAIVRDRGGVAFEELGELEERRPPAVERLGQLRRAVARLRDCLMEIEIADHQLVHDGWESGEPMIIIGEFQPDTIRPGLQALTTRGLYGAYRAQATIDDIAAVRHCHPDLERAVERFRATDVAIEPRVWMHEVRTTFTTLVTSLTEAESLVAEELVEIDRRRVEILTAQ